MSIKFLCVTAISLGVTVTFAISVGIVQALMLAEEHLKRHIKEEKHDE